MWGSVLLIGLFASAIQAAAVNEETKEDSNTVGGFVKNERIVEDPCSGKLCGPGRECDLDEDSNPICVCARSCPEEREDDKTRARVCSTHNVTFDSECELYRVQCLCHKRSPECPDVRYEQTRMDYFGNCIAIPECTEYEMEGYPERMRNWLYLIMEELARREDLPKYAQQMADQAKSLSSRRWVLPVIWKFCDMDESDDRYVSVEELGVLSAPLKSLEHCTGPFLRGCDTDSDGRISLQEWGTCLGLEQEEIDDRCQALKD